MDVDFFIDKYQLNKSEAQVLKYMSKNKHELRNTGVRDIAKVNFVSTATIVNMAKKIGYSGYSELVFAISSPMAQTIITKVNPETKKQFIRLIKKYEDKVIMILGSGFSQNIANYFSEYFNLYGFRATANSHLEFLRKTSKENVLIFVISNSGDTTRLVELSELAKENEIELIAFTGKQNSKLEKVATLTINVQESNLQSFNEHEPNLFFGNALNQFEILMSEYFKA